MTPSRTRCQASPSPVRARTATVMIAAAPTARRLYFAGLVAHAAPEMPSGEVRSGLVVPAVQNAEEAQQAAAAVMSEDDRKRGDPLRPEDLAKTAPDHHEGAEGHCILPSHDTTDSDVHPARDGRGHASLHSLSDSDEILYSAQRRIDGGAATPKTLKERPPEAAGRASPSRSRGKSSSRLQFKHLQKRWDDDLERDQLAKSRSESADAATADSVSRDEWCLRARLEQVDGILETLSFSSPFLPSPLPLRSSEAGAIRGKQKELEREKEVERASWHIANRLASAFNDADARNNLLGRGEWGIISERARSRSPGPAETHADWIARHTYASMIKARPPPPPPPPTPQLDEMSRKCEMLDTLLQQRNEKIRALKSDLVIADTAREKLSTNVNILEGTVETLRQQNVHCEGQLVNSVDVCNVLKEELTKFANRLKESDRALEKQRELLLNVKADSETKMKDRQFHEASMRSQIEALKSQLDIAERACESQGQHHLHLMSELENQMVTLQKEQREDGDKFAHELGRAAAREAELAETNRQLTRKCEMLDTLLQQRNEKIRALKSDLVIADTAREKLSTNVNILEGTVETLRQQNVHCEGQLVNSVDVCNVLKEELTKFANRLKESDRALEKQRELLLNVKADSETKMKDRQFHEASMRSQIEALKSQLDIAERACESQGHLMSELENQMATLQEQKEDGDKFAHELGRAAAREAELAETNRQLTRKCEMLDTLLQQRDDNQVAILQEQKKDGEKFQSIMRLSAAREAEVAETNRQLRRDIAVLREQVARLSSSVRKPRTVFGS
jgi:DNA repair exonuclease SbcCD ATPase subunit